MDSHDTAILAREASKPGQHPATVNKASSVCESRPARGSRVSSRASTETPNNVRGSTGRTSATPSIPFLEPFATVVATATPVAADAAVGQIATPVDLVHDTPAAASTAAQLKRNYAVAMGQNHAGTMRVVAEHDPENREIKRLRQQGKLKWGEIAEILNKKRVAAGKLPGLTDNAVYSRYARNGPRIAAANGEEWDPSSIGPHVSKRAEPMTPIVGFDAVEDEMLVKAYQEIQQETWELVSERIVAMGGKQHDPEICARRYQAI